MKYRQENTFSGSFVYIQGEEDDEYKYDVTGYISLAKAYKERVCSYEMLYSLINSLMHEGRRLESEGKDMNGWILDPEHVYLPVSLINNTNDNKEFTDYSNKDKLEHRVRFLHYPGKTNLLMEKELLNFAEFVIEHTDYKDKDAVNMAYDFYLRVYRKNYVFDDLLQ